MGIKKADLTRYLKTKLLPLFGEGWFIYGGTYILRLSGFLLQGVVLDRSRYLNEFAPTPFVMVLSEPNDDYFMHFTLGGYLKDHRGGKYSLPLPLDRGYYTDNDIRTRWRDVRFTPEGHPDPVWLYEIIREQARPRIDAPLTLEAVHTYLTQDKRDSDHFAVLWSRGIVDGLLGDIEGARKWLCQVEKTRAKKQEDWQKSGQPVPEWIGKDLTSLRQMISHTTDVDDFRRYCEEVAARNKEKLKLPVG